MLPAQLRFLAAIFLFPAGLFLSSTPSSESYGNYILPHLRTYVLYLIRVIGCLRMSTQCSGAMARDGWLLYSQSIDQDCIEIRYLLNNPSRLSRSRAGERQTEALCLGWWSRYSTYPHSADAEANVLVQKRRIVYGTGHKPTYETYELAWGPVTEARRWVRRPRGPVGTCFIICQSPPTFP